MNSFLSLVQLLKARRRGPVPKGWGTYPHLCLEAPEGPGCTQEECDCPLLGLVDSGGDFAELDPEPGQGPGNLSPRGA